MDVGRTLVPRAEGTLRFMGKAAKNPRRQAASYKQLIAGPRRRGYPRSPHALGKLASRVCHTAHRLDGEIH